MEKKEQYSFDRWWFENRECLLTIYNEEPDVNIAVMTIAERSWKGALNAENNNIK